MICEGQRPGFSNRRNSSRLFGCNLVMLLTCFAIVVSFFGFSFEVESLSQSDAYKQQLGANEQKITGADFNASTYKKQLGKGGFGIVDLYKSFLGLYFAVKKSRNAKEIQLLKNEQMILSKLDHPYIIKYYGYFSVVEDATSYLALEYAVGGDLSMLLRKKKRFTEKEAAKVFLLLF